MRVLVACEFSGIVREAFRKRGHSAWSCDLLPTEIEDEWGHIQCDVISFLEGCFAFWPDGWGYKRFDLMIAFPPCTHLASSGARWFPYKRVEQWQALRFIASLMTAPIPRIAIENPIGVISTRIRKPDQIIQPWQFGHGETKATCLWLKGLPLLKPTNIVGGREGRIWKEPPSEDRWKNRSRTYQGIADAMAEQWG